MALYLRHTGYALRWHPINVLVRRGLPMIAAARWIDGTEAQCTTAAIAELTVHNDQSKWPNDQIENGENDGDGIVVGSEPADDADQIE